jgi:hypothetical protein
MDMYFTTQAAAIADGRPADAVGLARYTFEGGRQYQWVDEADVYELGAYDIDFELLLAKD